MVGCDKREFKILEGLWLLLFLYIDNLIKSKGRVKKEIKENIEYFDKNT